MQDRGSEELVVVVVVEGGPHEIQSDRYDVIKILIRRAGHARATMPGAGG